MDGLDLDRSTPFTAFELAELDVEREIVLMVRRRLTPDEIAIAPGLLTYLAELISAIVADAGSIRRAANLLDVPRSTLGARMRRARP